MRILSCVSYTGFLKILKIWDFRHFFQKNLFFEILGVKIHLKIRDSHLVENSIPFVCDLLQHTLIYQLTTIFGSKLRDVTKTSAHKFSDEDKIFHGVKLMSDKVLKVWWRYP